jgi:hypothetical protein
VKVFLLFRGIHYEGSDVLGVYSTSALARAAFVEHVRKSRAAECSMGDSYGILSYTVDRNTAPMAWEKPEGEWEQLDHYSVREEGGA